MQKLNLLKDKRKGVNDIKVNKSFESAPQSKRLLTVNGIVLLWDYLGRKYSLKKLKNSQISGLRHSSVFDKYSNKNGFHDIRLGNHVLINKMYNYFYRKEYS